MLGGERKGSFAERNESIYSFFIKRDEEEINGAKKRRNQRAHTAACGNKSPWRDVAPLCVLFSLTTVSRHFPARRFLSAHFFLFNRTFAHFHSFRSLGSYFSYCEKREFASELTIKNHGSN